VDIYLVFCESLLIFDNVRHTIRIVSCCHLPDFSTRNEAYEATVRKIEATIRVLRQRGKPDDHGGSPEEPDVLRIRSNMSRQHYLEAFERPSGMSRRATSSRLCSRNG